MANPQRGRGGFANGRGTPLPRRDAEPSSNRATGTEEPRIVPGDNVQNYRGRGGTRGLGPRGGAGRGGSIDALGGSGRFGGNETVLQPRGGGSRGRGRGRGAQRTAS